MSAVISVNQREDMLNLLSAWAEQGVIRPLDLALTRSLADGAEPLQLLAAAMVSAQAGRGHLLIDIADGMQSIVWPAGSDEVLPIAPAQLLAGISPSEIVASLERWDKVADGSEPTPLVLNSGALYLRRYWLQEQQITKAIRARFELLKPDPQLLKQHLNWFYPNDDDEEIDWQKAACALAARSSFTVIAGGPGTGKTTTVIRLLAILQMQQLIAGERPISIQLAAPTGKAAARLRQSIHDQFSALVLPEEVDADAVLSAIPRDVSTLHRLLGAQGGGRFRFNRFQQLNADLVVVDEASMIDVELMAALMDALPRTASLVLIGDKDQLASVEAGAVLGSLCRNASEERFDVETRAWLEDTAGCSFEEIPAYTGGELHQHIVILKRSHRFGDDSSIGRLASWVKDSSSRESITDLFKDSQLQHLDQHSDLETLTLADGWPGQKAWLQLMAQRRPAQGASFAEYDRWAQQIFKERSRFQLLTPMQVGPWGVEALNRRTETLLARERLVLMQRSGQEWYEGRPVLITQNNYQLGLMNGDVGIALSVPLSEGSSEMTLRVAFQSSEEEGAIRWILPSRIPQCQTVFAMTVHKSQGSEFDHVGLVLPDEWNPLLTKELIYTAVTRARSQFSLSCRNLEVFNQAVATRTERASRLFQN